VAFEAVMEYLALRVVELAAELEEPSLVAWQVPLALV